MKRASLGVWARRFAELVGLVDDQSDAITRLRKEIESLWCQLNAAREEVWRALTACEPADLELHQGDAASVIRGLYARVESLTAQLAEAGAERDNLAARLSDAEGKGCTLHSHAPRGQEAEELRAGVEGVLAHSVMDDDARDVRKSLHDLPNHVIACPEDCERHHE